MKTLQIIAAFNFILFVTSCSPSQMKAIVDSSTGINQGAGNSCPANSKETMAQKIQALNQQFPLPQASVAPPSQKVAPEDFASLTNNGSTSIKTGTEIILTVDRLCLTENVDLGLLNDIKKQLLQTTRVGIALDQSVKWTLPKAMSLAELQALLAPLPCIRVASPNGKLELTTQFPKSVSAPSFEANDPYYPTLNHLHDVGQPNVYQKLFGKPVLTENQILVAVIDTGSDLDHPDMLGQYWANTKELNGQPGIDDDGNGYIDDIHGYAFNKKNGDLSTVFFIPHGEHVAGLIAANLNNGIGVAGIAASRVKVMHLNIFDPLGGTDPLVLLEEALRYAADNGARVVNMSLGRQGKSQTTLQALMYAASRGVLLMAAAGNNSQELTYTNFDFSPAIYAEQIPGMMSIAAIDAAPGGGSGKCGFSNFSTSFVDLAAPGCDTSAGHTDGGLLSTVWMRTGTNYHEYGYMAGTSMATPIAVGAAALVMSYIKEKAGVDPTNVLVEDIMKKGARHQLNLDAQVSGGRALDLPMLFDYIDTQILQIDPNCL